MITDTASLRILVSDGQQVSIRISGNSVTGKVSLVKMKSASLKQPDENSGYILLDQYLVISRL